MAPYASQVLVGRTLLRKKGAQTPTLAEQPKPVIVVGTSWELMGHLLLYVTVYGASLFFSYEEKKR